MWFSSELMLNLIVWYKKFGDQGWKIQLLNQIKTQIKLDRGEKTYKNCILNKRWKMHLKGCQHYKNTIKKHIFLSTASDGVLHVARAAGLPGQGPVLLPVGEHPRKNSCVNWEALHRLCVVSKQGPDPLPQVAQAHSNGGSFWKQCKFSCPFYWVKTHSVSLSEYCFWRFIWRWIESQAWNQMLNINLSTWN